MDWFSAVFCVAAALCASGRGALLVLLLLSLTLLFTTALARLWQHKRFGAQTAATALFAVGVGGALWRGFSALSPQNTQDLGPVLPVCVLLLLCAFASAQSPTVGRLARGSVSLLVIGGIRELLSSATLFGYPFAFSPLGATFAKSGNGMVGAGGLLVAAAGMWIFGITHPFPKAPVPRVKDSLCLGLTTAAAALLTSVLKTMIPHFPDAWLFFTALLLAITPITLSPLPDECMLIPPALACVIAPSSPLSAILAGAVTVILWPTFTALLDRLHHASLPRRFAGAPLLLIVAAVGIGILGAAG